MAELEDLALRVEALEQRLDNICNGLESVKNRQCAIEEDVMNLGDGLEKLELEQAELENAVSSLQQERAEINLAIAGLTKLLLHDMGLVKLKPAPESLVELRELIKLVIESD